MKRSRVNAGTLGSGRHVAQDPEERRRRIAEAAYLKFLSRGATDGNPDSDWYEAEREVGRLLEATSASSRE